MTRAASTDGRVGWFAPRRWLRLPSRTVRLRLTLLYSGLFFALGLVLLVGMYLIFRGNSGIHLIVPDLGPHRGGGLSGISRNSAVARRVNRMFIASLARESHGLHEGLIESGLALVIVTLVSIALGWVVAGRVLRPLRVITTTTQQISERNLNERLAFTGPRDELKDLADTVDGLLARLEAHVAEQRRFAANASHELRTPLAITQTLLDVARNGAERDESRLVERLHEVNTRAIAVTEALLLLSRSDQRSFTREQVDLSLITDEAIETLLPLAEERGTALEISAETAPTAGSHALLLQLATNLVQNAIVHNLPAGGTVWVKTSVQQGSVTLAVENTGPKLDPKLVAMLHEPFQRGTERIRADDAGVGLGLAIVKSITDAHGGTLTITPRGAGGLLVTVAIGPTPPHIVG